MVKDTIAHLVPLRNGSNRLLASALMPSAAPRATRGEVVWSPGTAPSAIAAFAEFVEDTVGRRFRDYESLHEWSVNERERFWELFSRWSDVPWRQPPTSTLADESAPMWNERWWPNACINYVDRVRQMGRGHEGEVAVVGISQSRDRVELTWGQLFAHVAESRRHLQSHGVGVGDCVAALLPNVPEALIVFLATASLGAVFSSCPPEFGSDAVISRFEQISPKVMYYCDNYQFGTKSIDKRESVAQIIASLPTLVMTHRVELRAPFEVAPPISADALTTDSVQSNHPLYVLYSSGTTGQPKGIVHGHAGIVHEHIKMLSLHHDLRRGDRFMWFSTTGWMMWNYLVSGLLVGAAVVVFDGDPAFPDLTTLWGIAARERLTMLGVGAPFLHSCNKANLSPRRDHDLTSLRIVGSTGSPLLAEGFHWVRDHVGTHVAVHSISGGTDMCTAFLGMSPMLPVRAGEISCAALGADVQAWRADGTPCAVGETGELVIAKSMPSMPVSLWNDPERSRLRATYFEHFPGVWRHGDWITFFADGMCVVGGRSDATLNRGGVRSGTSEYYGVVESLPFVVDSLIVHLTDRGDVEGRLILFVKTHDGTLSIEQRKNIVEVLRSKISPRHVPDEVHCVTLVPRTLSGKKLEIPVKRVLQGSSIDDVCSRSSLLDATSLDEYVALRQVLAESPSP